MIDERGYNKTVTELFESHVVTHSASMAVKDKYNEYTYSALNEQSNQIAHYLRSQSIQPGDFVALLLEPGADFIICLLAIIKLGAVYIPLDTHSPKKRLTELLYDATPKALITNEFFDAYCSEMDIRHYLIQSLHEASSECSKNNLETLSAPHSALYMMYTSGSTGRPKGVIVPHQAVVNMGFVENTMHLGANQKIAQFSNISFDGSSFELWTALLNGACLCIIPSEARFNPSKLKKSLCNYEVTFLFLPTSYLHQLIKSEPSVLDSIETLLFGGEQINAALINQFLQYRREIQRDVVLINGYGPTETTAYVCRQIIDSRHQYDKSYIESIGQLVANTKAYLLDEKINPTLEGELYISGINLALGYHQCDVQNNERFIANPFSDEPLYQRLYKTGDKVRRLESGDFLYLGRIDDQVKVGGFRIHLNEIENALIEHPKVSMAAVQVEVSQGLHKLLTAYLVFSEEEIVYADELRDWLQKTLPSYMLPAKWLKVDKLPLTHVGKVDKSKLEKMPSTDLSLHIDVSLDSSVEEKIQQIWQDLLHLNSIDTNKNLFDLGANSLLITEACSRINKKLKTELKVGELLSHPTIHKLSRFIEGAIDVMTIKKRRKTYASDIAIVGMSCNFPSANTLESFWKHLCEGKETLSQFELSEDKPSNYVPIRGVLSDIEQFDAAFFGFNATEASLADPQQRLLLECTWHALEHAGIAPNKMSDKIISVFAGMSDSTYLQENLLKNNQVQKEHDLLHQRIASSTSMLSTQISYRLNLQGRSVNINTACSTGLVAIDQACQELILGYSDIALAGAASVVVPQQQGYLYQAGSIVSADGHCRPFSKEANGTVFSNGVGVVVLKRLQDAIKDNDLIYAVIKGRGINNDGASKLGFTAPSTLGQMMCIRTALEEAHIAPSEIGYVEAHGTATELGDVIEFDALNTVYQEHTSNKRYCVLGSVKANIGHTDVVAGIAGLIKTTLCLYHHKIPPLIHYKEPNPHLGLEDSPFFINKKLLHWDTGVKKRYAAVSCFGVGGTNAHMILSDYDNHLASSSTTIKDEILILSAKTQKALEDYVVTMHEYLTAPANKKIALESIAYSLQIGKEDFSWRHFAVGSNKEEMSHDVHNREVVFFKENTHESIIFMFPGQGTQYPKMAMELYDHYPQFAEHIDKGITLAQQYLSIDLLELIQSEGEALNQTQYAQPALFIIEYALAQLVITCGIKPDGLIGHSLGEYVAACVAGVFSFEEGIKLICSRGALMSSAAKGAMLALECAKEDVYALAERFSVEVSLHNSTTQWVLSGDEQSMSQLEHHLNSINTLYQKLNVSHAFHSSLMDPLKNQFLALFADIHLRTPSIDIISNVTGDWHYSEQVRTPDYWFDQLRQPVQFDQGLRTVLKDKHPLFIELGMGHSLSAFLKGVLRTSSLITKPHLIHLLPNRHKKVRDTYQLLTGLGYAWQQGVNVFWPALYPKTLPGKTTLPSYPFQKHYYWIDPDPMLPLNQTNLYVPSWSRKVLSKDYDLNSELIQQHSWVIFKDQSSLSDEFIVFLQHQGAHVVLIEFNDYFEQINPTYFKINPKEKKQYLNCMTRLRADLKTPYFIHLSSLEAAKHQTDSTHQLNLGFYSVLYLCQAFLEVMGLDFPIKGVILTCGTAQITGQEPNVPVNGCIHGACAVLRREYPTFQIRSLDLDVSPTSAHNTIQFLVQYMLQTWDTYFTGLALRNNVSWDLNYHNLALHSDKNPFKNNGVYLITGGIGAMALTLCEVIVSHVKNPHLILLSRSPALEEEYWASAAHDANHSQYSQIKALENLKKEGAIIHWHQLDILDEQGLITLIKGYKDQLGTINGLIHTAGIAGGGIIPLKRFEEANRVLLPKIQGTFNLANALKNTPLDFVVLMSSLVALIGEAGQIDYAAANAALNTFATSDMFQSDTVISINWNTWSDVGMAVHSSTENPIEFVNRGNDISSHKAKELFYNIVQSGHSQVVVSNYELQHHDAILAHYRTKKTIQSTKTAREALALATRYAPPHNKMEEVLARLWQSSLGMECIGIDDDFFSLGGHSLNALQLIDKTNKQFGCSLSIQQLYKYSTIRQFSSLLLDNLPAKVDILVPMSHCMTPPYIFVCHPASGMVYCFNTLCTQASSSFSVFGLQDPSITEGKMLYTTVVEMAKAYLNAIKEVQPHGPYYLLGYSFGGTLVYEMSHLLHQHNESIAFLGLIDSWCVFSEHHHDKNRFINQFKQANPHCSDMLSSLAWERMKLLLEHTPSETNQTMSLFKASELIEEYKSINHPTNGWSKFNKGLINCYLIPANHDSILNSTHSLTILDILKEKGIF